MALHLIRVVFWREGNDPVISGIRVTSDFDVSPRAPMSELGNGLICTPYQIGFLGRREWPCDIWEVSGPFALCSCILRLALNNE